MLQRLQTVFLILALVSISLTFVFDILAFSGENSVHYGILGLKSNLDLSSIQSYNWIVLGLVIAIMLVLVVAILQYKNRPLQMNLCRLTMFLSMGVVASLFFIINSLITKINFEDYIIGYGIGYFLPMVTLVFSFLALNRIRKDEELVKSVDRLR